MTRSNTRTNRPSNENTALDSTAMENKAGGLDASPDEQANEPAETPAEPVELMEGIEVKMLQHWTNPEGKNVPPSEEPIVLDPATAARLVQANWAEYV